MTSALACDDTQGLGDEVLHIRRRARGGAGALGSAAAPSRAGVHPGRPGRARGGRGPLLVLAAAVMLAWSGPVASARAGAGSPVSAGGGTIVVQNAARDALHPAASSACGWAPDGKGALSIDDLARLNANADVLAVQKLAAYDVAQAAAFGRMWTLTACLLQAGAAGGAGSDLFNRLYNTTMTPLPKSALQSSIGNVLTALRAKPQSTLDGVRTAYLNAFGTLGVPLELAAVISVSAPTQSPSAPSTPAPAAPSEPRIVPFGSVSVVREGKLITDFTAMDAVERASRTDVYNGRDGKGPLSCADPARALAVADLAVSQGLLANFDRAQVTAVTRLFYLVSACFTRAETGTMADAAGRLWHGLYDKNPVVTGELSAGASALLSSLAAAGKTTAVVDSARVALTTNFAAIGVTLDLSSSPPVNSGPVAVNGDELNIQAQFASGCYQAASRTMFPDANTRLRINQPGLLLERSGPASSTLDGGSTVAVGCTRITVLSLVAMDGPSEALRAAGKTLNDLIQGGRHSVRAVTAASVALQAIAIEDGLLADDTAGSKLHDLLVSGLGKLGIDASAVPAAGPVPDPTLFAGLKKGSYRLDAQAASDLYHCSVAAGRGLYGQQIGDIERVRTQADEWLRTQTTDDKYNQPQARAFCVALGLATTAFDFGKTEPMRKAGERAFYTLIRTDQKPADPTEIATEFKALYATAIKEGAFPNWPEAEKLGDAFETDLAKLQVTVKMATLTSIFGPNPSAAKVSLPGTDFATATNGGGSIRNANASLEVPATCAIDGSVLISVTALETRPVYADQTIHAPWSGCEPTIGVRATDADDLTMVSWVNTATGDRIDYDAAGTRADGWAYTKVPHLSQHEDDEDGFVQDAKETVGRFLSVRGAAPDCGSAGTSRIHFSGNGWRTCNRENSDGSANIRATYNLGVCSRVEARSGSFSVDHGDSISVRALDLAFPGTIVCAGSTITARVDYGETLDLRVTHDSDATALFNLVGSTADGVVALAGENRATLSGQLFSDAYGCARTTGTFTADTVNNCVGTLLDSGRYLTYSDGGKKLFLKLHASGYTNSQGVRVQNPFGRWYATGAKVSKGFAKVVKNLTGGGVALYVGRDSLTNADLTVTHDLPPRPDRDSSGRYVPANCTAWSPGARSWTINAACVGQANTAPAGQQTGASPSSSPSAANRPILLKRSNSNAAFVLDAAGVARSVPDGGSYLRCKDSMPTQFNVDDGEWAAMVRSVGSNTNCSGMVLRKISPESVEGYVVRTEDGRTWFNQNRYRIPIFSGSTACFMERYYVWDLVSSTELAALKLHPSIAATGC